jgi:hypothetical protein
MTASVTRARTEAGQIFILTALWSIALFGLVGLAVDVGLMFVAKAELRRDVDAAALAAIVELPNTTNVSTRATEYLAANDPQATLVSVGYPATGQIQLNVSKQQRLVFLPLLPAISSILIGGNSINITGFAIAGAGAAIDLGMSIDDTGSMDSGCNSTQTDTDGTCPIREAREGAKVLIDIVGVGDGSGIAAGSMVPARGCYNSSGSGGCVDFSGSGNKVIDLTTNKTTLVNGINALVAAGGSGTNICTGAFYSGDRVLNSPAARTNARKVVVILSDFANTGGSQTPFPSPYSSTKCARSGSTTNAHINAQDRKTLEEVNLHKAAGVEFFVIGYNISGTATTEACNSGNTWSTTILAGSQSGTRDSSTDPWDRRLAKCVASSTAGTNDHYFEAPTSAALNAAFTQIGKIISTRLIK